LLPFKIQFGFAVEDPISWILLLDARDPFRKSVMFLEYVEILQILDKDVFEKKNPSLYLSVRFAAGTGTRTVPAFAKQSSPCLVKLQPRLVSDLFCHCMLSS
jgi:hypothetical protein